MRFVFVYALREYNADKKREPLAALLINRERKWQFNGNRLRVSKEAVIGHVGVILRRAKTLSRVDIAHKPVTKYCQKC